MIEQGQHEQIKCPRTESLDKSLDFCLTNNKLANKQVRAATRDGHRDKSRRALAHVCHITYQETTGDWGSVAFKDIDIARAPALMQRTNAAACAGVVDNPQGLLLVFARR